MKAVQTLIQKLKKLVRASAKLQQGWTTMEYVVGAIVMAGIVTGILGVFNSKLTEAINALVIPH